MSSEQNKEIIRRFIEEVNNKREKTDVEQYLTPQYLDHSAPPKLPRGPEGWRILRAMFFTAFSNLHITIEQMVAEGDRVAIRFTMRAVHTGELRGIPPTGKQLTLTGLDINRFEGGKIAERWGNQNDLGMMQQLGVIPMQQQS
jgi:predicted ester cyclase